MNTSRWSLHQLLLWTGVAALLTLFVPMALYVTQAVSMAAERSLEASGLSLARTLRSQIIEPMLLEDKLALHDALHKAVPVEGDIRYLCVANAEGRIIAHTFSEADGYPASLVDLWQDSEAATLRFHTEDEPLLDISMPVMDGQLGTLHVGMSRLRAVESGRRLLRWMGLALAVAMAIFLAGAQIVSAKVSRPLRLLEEVVSRIPAQAEAGYVLAAPYAVAGTKEVVSLARSFLEMARRLVSLERERSATQERMVHAERLAALGELAAGLAHEVNNPLDGMLESLRYLDADPDKGQRGAKYYPLLRDGLQRIARAMRGMLTFARCGQDVSVEPCRVAHVGAALKALVGPHLEGRNVHLTWAGAKRCVCVCDRQGLLQAGLNLILNAADAAEGSEPPEVRIETSCDAEWVYLAVEDSGTGVPEGLKDRIFEPFFTTKPIEKGTGLGLSISRQVIRASGGELELSPGPGLLGGAKFLIRLPKHPSSECDNDAAAS
jgi:two-component system NtrC family sensor kinase